MQYVAPESILGVGVGEGVDWVRNQGIMNVSEILLILSCSGRLELSVTSQYLSLVNQVSKQDETEPSLGLQIHYVVSAFPRRNS